MADTNPKITLTFDDQATPALNSIIASLARLQQAGTANAAWVTQLSGLLGTQQQAAQATTQSTNQLAAAVSAQTHAIQQQTQGYAQVNTAMLAHQQQQAQVRTALQQQVQAQQAATAATHAGTSAWKLMLSVAGGVGIATSVGAMATALVSFGKSIIEVGSQFQTLRVSLNAVTGGTQQGQQAFQFIAKTADTLGFSVTSLATAYKGLTAAAAGTALEGKQTQQLFTAVATAARTLGLTTEASTGVMLALQQMMSKGTVQSEELRGQLGERLPGAFNIAARAIGVSTAELSKMLEAGQVIAQDFLPKFAAQLQKELGGGAKDAAQTASVAFQRLENEWMLLKERIAQSGPLTLVATIAGSAAALLTGGAKTDADLGRRAAQMLGQGATQAEVERTKGILAEGQAINEGPIAPTPEITALRNRIGFRRLEAGGAPARAGAYDTGQAATAAARSQAEELNKLFEGARKQVEGVTALNKLAPERLGDTTNKSDRRIAELNSLLKVEKEQLETIAKAAVASGSALDETQEKNLAGLRASIRTREAEIEKIKEADKLQAQGERRGETAQRQAAKAQAAEVARQAKDTAKMLADMEIAARFAETMATAGGDPDAERLAKNANEEATLRQTIAEKGLGEAVEQTALAFLHQRQAAEDNASTIKVMVKEQHERIQEFAKNLDIFGLNVSPDEEAQRAFTKKLQDAVAAAQAPKTERPEAKLRAQLPGGVATPEQEALFRTLTAARKAEEQARQMDRIADNLASNIQSTFDNLWEQVFTGGVTSFQKFGLLVAQSLQRTFAQLTSQLMNMLLNVATGTQDEKGGLFGAIARGVVGMGTAAAGASVGPGSAPGTGTDLATLFGGGGIASGLGTIRALAGGAVVSKPSFALLGERPGSQEAVIPMAGGAVPVQFTGQQAQQNQPIVIEIHNDYTNAVSPSQLKTGKREIIKHFIDDYNSDGPIRRTIKHG